jgi:hypothetical protein
MPRLRNFFIITVEQLSNINYKAHGVMSAATAKGTTSATATATTRATAMTPNPPKQQLL